jgi:excisionase family DNA binding protein
VNNRWLPVDEIAENLGVSKDTVYTWVANKNMRGHKGGRLWTFKTSEIDEWMRTGGASSKANSKGNAEGKS